jgi:SnoaL-like domain
MIGGASRRRQKEPAAMSDRDDIANTVAALAIHVDARDWAALTALFTPEATTDYRSLGGDVRTQKREELVAGWRKMLPGFTRTEHLIGAPLIMISGNRAEIRASVTAWHTIEDAGLANGRWVAGGRYEMALEKGADRVWRIARLTLANAWQEGNSDLPGLARGRAASRS